MFCHTAFFGHLERELISKYLPQRILEVTPHADYKMDNNVCT